MLAPAGSAGAQCQARHVTRLLPQGTTTMESLSLVKSAVAEIISTSSDDSLKRLAMVLEQLCSVVDEVERVARDAMEEARRATRAARK
jgi:hypothetical protein